MILDFSNDVDAILDALGLDPDEPKQQMKVAMILATVLDRGMAMERDRCIRIIQQHATRPIELVERIRRLVR